LIEVVIKQKVVCSAVVFGGDQMHKCFMIILKHGLVLNHHICTNLYMHIVISRNYQRGLLAIQSDLTSIVIDKLASEEFDFLAYSPE